MKSFTFRLERVRSLREHAETVAKEALARELATGAERTGELRRAEDALTTALAVGAPVDGFLSGGELLARQAFIERRERERLTAELAAQDQDQAVSRQQAHFEAAAG